ncbi:MAG: UDP-2,4-diacetamido-2,4,6-trideoxy-beta-L-altropyranose hydrolase [Selenomonadaceae bacterium]|nr:UDP-2,4-diacetamido-2,4,6-trideoxy-beta-L-altropyranose hydrolase [Selenomonadaceae bacterium]
MRVVIRVDSSFLIGSGHLMRCLTLAEQLRQKGVYDIVFVSRNLEGNLCSLIKSLGFTLVTLPKHDANPNLEGYATWLTVSQELDAKETIFAISRPQKVDWLIVDSYAIDETWENMLRPFVNHIMAIDDLANRKHNVDALLDQNFSPNREKVYEGLVPKECSLLMGLDYLLLRDEFYVAKKEMRQRNGGIDRILVFFGGADLTDETSKTLEAMEYFPEIYVDVAVGGSNPHAEKIADRCRTHEKWKYHYQVDYMASLMANADLAIGAGGTATWERCFLELPSLVVSIADNQSGGGEYYDSLGIWKYLGESKSVSALDIVSAVKEICRTSKLYGKMINAMRKLFENHKQGRAADILMNAR